jgi:putative ABC transport system ATP-binding protein
MAILKLRDICKDYQQGKEPVRVLKNVNLTVEKGEYLAIMGPSGSGKTTLMNLIGCLDVPTSGSYELDGRNLKDLSDDDLADIRNKHIGFVFQSFHLLPKMDALDNVALPLLYADVPLQERRERAAEALKAVGLEERIHFLPNQLSGGQCQRVAIARAIVTKPDLLLADEPTGALDTKAGAQIMEIFRELSNTGMTIIMITHEPGIAECADKTYRILDGELYTDQMGDNHETITQME